MEQDSAFVRARHGSGSKDTSAEEASQASTAKSSTFFLSKDETNQKNDTAGKLGTVNGVFLPCLQTILGVILFLRLPFVTSQAGCVMTTVIIGLCTLSSFLTALSLSVIATNGIIRAGGPYYVISRTLGAEIGGSIGILFYLGNTLSTSLYVLGAVETFQSIAISRVISFRPDYDTQVMALLLVFLITNVVLIGVKYINMTSSLFLIIVILSVFSIAVGGILFTMGIYYGAMLPADRVFMSNIWPNYYTDPVTDISYDFFAMVALFYPSVTGILAGANRSALLADPAKAIPKGTLAAIVATTLIYLFFVWLFGTTIAHITLRNDKLVMAAIAWPQVHLIRFGIIISCIGASLQCMTGATQLITAMANDEAYPILTYFKPSPNSTSSKRAIWLTWLLASLPTLFGNIDHITPFVTMFFLLTYSGINLSCFLLSFLKTPGFRPTFKFHWSISFIGFLYCLALALIISWYTALISFFFFFLIYIYNRKQTSNKNWGDVGNAIRYSIVTSFLRKLTGTTAEHFHAKNWRPQLLTILNTDPNTNHPADLHLLAFASQLNKGRGINMIVTILQNTTQSFESFSTMEKVDATRNNLRSHMQKEQVDGFGEVVVSSQQNLSHTIWSAVVHTGLGPLSPNTVMLPWLYSWKSQPDQASTYVKSLQGILNLKKALLIFKGDRSYPRSNAVVRNGTIDIWWVVHDGGLLLLLPYLLSRNSVWKRGGTSIRLFACIAATTENPDRLRDAVVDHLRQIRIPASVIVVDLSDTDIADHMRHMENIPDNPTANDPSFFSIANMNTGNMTVGEVFSSEVYDVPYQSFGDMEMGGYIEQPILTFSMPGVVSHEDSALGANEDGRKENRLHTAMAFNKALQEHSSTSNLVLTNMPLIRKDQPPSEFFEYVDTMSKGIDNIIFIRGTGSEVITSYA